MSENDLLSEQDANAKQAVIRLLTAMLPAVLTMTDNLDRAAAVEFGALLEEAARGERSAMDRIKNPWGTSESPKSALARARLRRGQARKSVIEHLTPLVAAFFALVEADEIKRSYEISKQRPISDDARHRFLGLLEDNGVTGRTIDRTSSNTIVRVAELLNDNATPAASEDVDLLASLKRNCLLDLVCRTDRGDWEDREYFTIEHARQERSNRLRYGDPYCYIPRQVALDTGRPPRGHARWQRRTMHDFMWDELGASPLFKVFVRSDENRDASRRDEPTLELPPFATVAEMLEHDKRFAAAYAKQLQNWRELDAQRTLRNYNANIRQERIFDEDDLENVGHRNRYADPAYISTFKLEELEDIDNFDYGTEPEKYHITQLLINFSAAQTDVIAFNVHWVAWKDWGILLATIDELCYGREMDVAPWEFHQNLVWLYFLKGRLCKSDALLPPQFRELLFDWLELPITFAEEACARYLVPVCALNGELGDDDATKTRRRAWARHKRIC